MSSKMETKLCLSCNLEKPITEFYKHRKQCKQCLVDKNRERRQLKRQMEDVPNYLKGNVTDIPEVKEEKVKDVNIESKSTPVEEENIIQEPKAEQNNGFTKKILSTGVKTGLELVFDVIAMRAGDHWKLKNQELESLSEAITNVLDKLTYAKEISQNMDYVNLAIVMFTVLTPKVSKSVKIKKEGKRNGENIPRPAKPEKPKPIDNSNKRRDTVEPVAEKQTKNISSKLSKEDHELQLFNENLLNDIL